MYIAFSPLEDSAKQLGQNCNPAMQECNPKRYIPNFSSYSNCAMASQTHTSHTQQSELLYEGHESGEVKEQLVPGVGVSFLLWCPHELKGHQVIYTNAA